MHELRTRSFDGPMTDPLAITPMPKVCMRWECQRSGENHDVKRNRRRGSRLHDVYALWLLVRTSSETPKEITFRVAFASAILF